MTVYERYCELRDEKGVKDKTVADAIGITRSTFSDWKKGRSEPKADKMIKIANYFDVSYSYLMGLTDKRQPDPHTIDISLLAELNGHTLSEPLLITYDDPNKQDRTRKALELYSAYLDAIPEIRDAVCNLLKVPRPDA